MKFSERSINKALYSHFMYYEYKLFNSFVFNWESDFFGISKSGYSIEIEVKISKADFKIDKEKKMYSWLYGTKDMKKHDHIIGDLTNKPNKFAYACPHGLIQLTDINPVYGLYWITDTGQVITKREPKFLHKEKMLESKKYLKILLDKFYFRNIKLRNEMILHEYDLKYKQKRIIF